MQNSFQTKNEVFFHCVYVPRAWQIPIKRASKRPNSHFAGLRSTRTIGKIESMSWDFSFCIARQDALTARFSHLNNPQDCYGRLIEMGRELAKLSCKDIALPEHLVRGCQSEVFLVARFENDKIFFDVYTEALISAGLVAILLEIYQGEAAETIIKCPPACLEKLGLNTSLTPARSNGLASIYLKMQQEALRLLVSSL